MCVVLLGLSITPRNSVKTKNKKRGETGLKQLLEVGREDKRLECAVSIGV